MNLTAYELSIISGGFTIVGALIGAIATYRFSIHLFIHQQRKIAAANFRASFAFLISQMRLAQSDPSIDKRDILNSTFKDISVAVELFRPYVHSCKQEAYQKAWENYYSDGISGKIHFQQYTHHLQINGVERDEYNIFTERVHHVLSFSVNP